MLGALLLLGNYAMPHSRFMEAVRSGQPIDDNTIPECRLMNDALLGGAFVADAERFWYASYSFAEMLGCTPSELTGTTFLDRFHVDTRTWLEGIARDPSGRAMHEPWLAELVPLDGTGRRDVLLRLKPAPYLGDSLFVGAVLDVTEKRRGERAMEDYARRLRLLSQQVMEIQENERRNLARELHDEIGQQLTMVKLTLAGLATRDEQMGEELAEALAAVSSLMQQVRDLSLDLRPSMLDDLGLAPTLRWYAGRVARLASIDAHLDLPAEFPRLKSGIETLYFRVAQEAITNVMRHAAASTLWLKLGIEENRVVLCVRDDGVGFEQDAARLRALQGGSAGLLGMQERAALAGAQFELVTSVGQGTLLRLSIATRDTLLPS